MFCKNCGTEIHETARFCHGCGAKVEQESCSPVCPACGTPAKAGAKFCRNCGTALGGGSPAPSAADDPNRPVCSYCGMQLASMDELCPECGLEAVTMQKYMDSWVCPECSELLDKGYSCPYCGKKAVLRRSLSAQGQSAPAPAPKPVPAPAPVPSFEPAQMSQPAQRTAADAPKPAQMSEPAQRPAAPAQRPAADAPPVVNAEITSVTITDGAPVAAPVRTPETGRQQTPLRASDRLKQQAGTAARQAAKTVLQKIMEIETPASSLPGETRVALNSEQMNVLSAVARSLFRR